MALFSKRKGLALFGAAAATVFALTACGGGSTPSTSAGKIRIGIKFDQPGLGFQDCSTYKGFDVDVAKYVANELGYSADKVEFVSSPSANRENMLANKQVDMIFATYSITDERKQRVAFAGPYFVAGQDLLVRKDETGITGKDSLSGKKLCSVTGSTSAEKVKKDVPGVNLVEQPGYANCLGLLEKGGIDAVTTDDIILAGLAAAPANQGKFKVVGNPFSEEKYGVGLPKGSDKCESINKAITKMIDSGEWKKALDANTQGTGYEPNAKTNPPKPDACS